MRKRAAETHEAHFLATMTEEAPEDERDIELSSITAIFPEAVIDHKNPHAALLDVEITPTNPLRISFSLYDPSLAAASTLHDVDCERTLDHTSSLSPARTSTDNHSLSYLPPLNLHIELPDGYPEEKPPTFHIDSLHDWLPQTVKARLDEEGRQLWEEYGRAQVVYAYIDFLQQETERAFGLGQDPDRPLLLPSILKAPLLHFDKTARKRKFDKGTFTCGICLEPKKGSACYQLQRCQHVFCVGCLQDFYNSAIAEGDVSSVKCLDPDCGMEHLKANERRSKKQHTLHPAELLDIPLEETQVQRYLDLKLKKKLESDPSTIYCPRKWCQGPAKSKKYIKYTLANLGDLPESDDDNEETTVVPAQQGQNGVVAAVPGNTNISTHRTPPPDRLQVCSICLYAFCRVCTKSWHGDLQHCLPKNPAELSAEEQASYDYIRLHTSACPTCASPCQKTHGCNHMCCTTCKSHFCYLCSAWLQPQDPYIHFNTQGTECYMRLWELEEGDEGEEALGRRANGRAVERVRGDEPAVGVVNEVLGLGDAPEGQANGNALGPGWRQFLQPGNRRQVLEWEDEGSVGDELEEDLIALMI